MARAADQLIMQFRRQPQNPAPNRLPKLFYLLKCGPACLACRSHNAYSSTKQIPSRRRYAHFFTSRHRMTSYEMRSNPREDRLQIPYYAALHTSNISHNCAPLHKRQHTFGEPAHLAQRRAEDDEISTINGRAQIQSCRISCFEFPALPHTGLPSNKPNDRFRQSLSL